MPASTLLWLILVTVVVVLGYAMRGDLGPLMVLVPATLGTVILWSLPSRGERGSRDRLVVLAAYLVLVVLGLALIRITLATLGNEVAGLPGIGTHVQRALDRFATYGGTLYTQSGHWSTTANWIAAGYYGGREHYVSNLHSDLAFVAVMQSYGVTAAIGLLALYLGTAAMLAVLGELTLARAERAWAQTARDRKSEDLERRRRYNRHAVPRLLEASTTSYFLFFCSLYLAFEVLVHVGTCFNTLPQTGLTLPWVSSGGSASVGFAVLLGAGLARSVRARARLSEAERSSK